MYKGYRMKNYKYILLVLVVTIGGCSSIRVSNKDILSTRDSVDSGLLLVTIAQSSGDLSNYSLKKIENGKEISYGTFLHDPFGFKSDLEAIPGRTMLVELPKGNYVITKTTGTSTAYIANYGGTTVYSPNTTSHGYMHFSVNVIPGRINYAGQVLFQGYRFLITDMSERDYPKIKKELDSIREEDFILNLAKEIKKD